MADPPFSNFGRTVVAISLIAAALDPWTYSYAGAASGRQPYGQRTLPPSITAVPVSNPPFCHAGRTAAGQAIAAAAAQPAYEPWTYEYVGSASGRQPYGQRALPPSLTAVPVNNPPFSHPARTVQQAAVTVLAAQPPDWNYSFEGGWQPYGPRWLSPSIIAVPVSNPPFSHSGRTPQAAITVSAAQPPEWNYSFEGGWQPYAPRKLNPSLTAVPVNNPPGVGVPHIIPVEDDPLPVLIRYLPLSVTAVPVSNPPFSHPGRWVQTLTAELAWQPPDPLPTLPTKVAAVFVPPPVVNNPPFGYRGFIWTDGPPLVFPQTGGQLILSVDNPPFSHPGRIVQTIEAVLAWQPPDPPPTLSPKLLPSALAVTVNNPPGVGVPHIIPVEDDPLPVLPQKMAAVLFVPPVVNNPPFTHPGRIVQTIEAVLAWQPPDPPPTLSPKIPPAALAVEVDNPPFAYPGRWPQNVTVRFAWEPPDPPPVQRGPLNPATLLVRVDNPPGYAYPHIVWVDDEYPYATLAARLGVPQPGPTPPPPTTGMFTVSGPSVQELFGPASGVALTWGNPGFVSKRTV